MNILVIVDKKGTAIDRLAEDIAKYVTWFNFRILPVHPKRPDAETMIELGKLLKWADVLSVNYWRSGEVIRNTYADDFKRLPKVLCHYNPYDIEKDNWAVLYDQVVVPNSTIQSVLAYAKLIPLMVDLERFTFNEDYEKNQGILMVASRIESKKGIRPVAAACRSLGYPFTLVGRISDQNYFDEIMQANPETEFLENVNESTLIEAYQSAALTVVNSVDNFESGPMPLLESMACGTPVMTRNVGHVVDLYDGANMVLYNGLNDRVDDIAKEIKDLIENPAQREKIRQKAWETVKNRPAEKMALMFSRLYYEVHNPDTRPLVSVVVPTFDNPDGLIKAIAHIVTQDYEHFELIIVDSGNESVGPIVGQFRSRTSIPIKYIRFDNRGEYTLAKARNLGVLEAEGEVIVFCDDRLAMKQGAIKNFIIDMRPQVWAYGVKDGAKKGFVENFSAIQRSELLRLGGFNERIDGYGGMSQELRTRYQDLGGFRLLCVHHAEAEEIAKSKHRSDKRRQTWKQKLNLWRLYGN